MSVNIQVQDIGGNWFTVNTTFDNNMQNITHKMNEVASAYHGKRVRAVSDNGQLIDVR